MAADPPTSRRTKILVGVCVIALLVATVYFAIGSVLLWQGGYELAIRFEIEGEQPKKVECGLVDRIEYVRSVQEYLGRTNNRPFFTRDTGSDLTDPFQGEPITLYNRTGGRENIFGIETDWYQSKFLIVVAHWPDGRKTMTVANVPDGRTSKEMTVRLP